MIYAATRRIAEYFDANDVKYSVEEGDNDENSYISARFSIKNGSNVRMLFISRDNDPDVSVRVFSVVHISDEKRLPILEAVNQINSQYRYAKFNLDGDNDVNVQYDFPVKLDIDGVGPVAYETFYRLWQILDDAYPTLMKAMWS